jgi:hypothetical protein
VREKGLNSERGQGFMPPVYPPANTRLPGVPAGRRRDELAVEVGRVFMRVRERGLKLEKGQGFLPLLCPPAKTRNTKRLCREAE